METVGATGGRDDDSADPLAVAFGAMGEIKRGDHAGGRWSIRERGVAGECGHGVSADPGVKVPSRKTGHIASGGGGGEHIEVIQLRHGVAGGGGGELEAVTPPR